jgi:uncharacterized membrane protein YphA (DoxX/SURF4 family)
VFVGLAFIGHGTQKLFGWWGGYGPQGTGGYFSSVGYRFGVQMAVLAGLAEAGGGALLALGLLTPVACAALAVVMINAIVAVTMKPGFMVAPSSSLRTSWSRSRSLRPAPDGSRSTARSAGTTRCPGSDGASEC